MGRNVTHGDSPAFVDMMDELQDRSRKSKEYLMFVNKINEKKGVKRD